MTSTILTNLTEIDETSKGRFSRSTQIQNVVSRQSPLSHLSLPMDTSFITSYDFYPVFLPLLKRTTTYPSL